MSGQPPEIPPAPEQEPAEPPRRQPGWLIALGVVSGVVAVLGAVTLVVGGVCVAMLNSFGG